MIKHFHWSDAPVQNIILTEYLLIMRKKDPSSQLGVSNGWSSAKDLFNNPIFKDLRDWISNHITVDHIISGWGNILDVGQHISLHNHVKSHLGGYNYLTGVYYIEIGDPLNFTDHLNFSPVPGELIFFLPSDAHWVPPVTARRISIAFNVKRIQS